MSQIRNILNRKKGDFNIVGVGVMILILTILTTLIVLSGFDFYQKVQERQFINKVDSFITHFEKSNFVGKGFDRDRIKYQILLFRNNSNFVDIYYYREFFERDLSTGQINPIPQFDFFGKERYSFGSDANISIISGTSSLILDTEEDEFMVAIRRELPHNNIRIFDGSSTFFNRLPEATKILGREYFIYGQHTINLFIPGPFDTDNYDVSSGVSIVDRDRVDFNIDYKNSSIGTLSFEASRNKIYFISKYERPGELE